MKALHVPSGNLCVYQFIMLEFCVLLFLSNLFYVKSFLTPKVLVNIRGELNNVHHVSYKTLHQLKRNVQFHEVKTTLEASTPEEEINEQQSISRRKLFQYSTSLTASLLIKPQQSDAGLVQFPCDYKLMNTYHIMRAGESILEGQDILSTNPLFLTNREDALSSVGKEQVEAACLDMAKRDVNPSVVKYSLAAKAIDTANIIASELQVGRNRLIPEYTFMDPRGIGLWDRQKLSSIEEAIWAMDYDEAGMHGYGGRPPENDDSTPNETLSNQVVRLRQLMSVLETQFSGDTILLVFSDGTSPALLSALIAGLPLHRTHELNFKPGEIRYDVTMENVLYSLPDELDTEYINKIARGRETLHSIRADPNLFTEVEPEENTFYQPITRTKTTRSNYKDLENRQDSQSDFLSFFGLGLFGMVASHFSKESQMVEKSDDDDDNVIDDKPLLVEGSASQVKNLNTTFDRNGNSEDFNLSDELLELDKLSLEASFDIPEMKQDRIERAEIAMEEYLKKDDGGEDWLNLMNEIMYEQEETKL